MKTKRNKNREVLKNYLAPKVEIVTVAIENSIAAGSTVQGTSMQQEHTEESRSQNVEW
ncbi:hypothetical protein [Sphingobacterium sp. DR205]|uniref:hypothetical protein n=1 Tax=Sphingobacterium sp. DR205 TaxID=2713573 RepID=UPI0013E50AEF|nr:hypothetical protein [Sphingobacterium sp. DR205]QIH34676.1 hypothetical protein G6053_18045 [Sphingobacterium sp. DR205]